MHTFRTACSGIISVLCICSCSLKYGTDTSGIEESVPEFTFSDAEFSRYKDKKNTMNVHADKIEQYKGGVKTYARNLTFIMLDKEGKAETKGSCGLLAADSDTEKYELYDTIHINNYTRKIELSADCLRWNGKTEQLTSSRNDTIAIKKSGTTIRGSGFSASGISNSFVFTGVVSGTVNTDDSIEKSTAETTDTVVPEKTARPVEELFDEER
jgi:LPS export ABC transporter protein LptC